MIIRMLVAAASLAITASAADAQDLPSPYENAITDNAQVQLESTLNRRRLQQARRRRAGGTNLAQAHAEDRARPTSEQIAACSKLGVFRRQYGATNAKVLRLTRSCRSVGL